MVNQPSSLVFGILLFVIVKFQRNQDGLLWFIASYSFWQSSVINGIVHSRSLSVVIGISGNNHSFLKDNLYGRVRKRLTKFGTDEVLKIWLAGLFFVFDTIWNKSLKFSRCAQSFSTIVSSGIMLKQWTVSNPAKFLLR